MDDLHREQPPWLPELMERLRQHLAALEDAEPDRGAALMNELSELDANIRGWTLTLANPELARELRAVIEQQGEEALQRKRQIEQQLREQAAIHSQAEEILDPGDVLSRLDRLADVLAMNNPTLCNLELSFHIDRIDCHADGRVEMRTCQLGALTGACELVADASPCQALDKTSAAPCRSANCSGPRRRTRLRLDDVDAPRSQLQASADFAADPDRFADLGDEWFWVDVFHVPEKTASWAEENAEAVQRRFAELKAASGRKPSLTVLADEFGKSRPTISAALKIAEHGGPIRDPRCKEPGSPLVDAKALADEFARLEKDEGMQRAAIAKRFGVHRNTVARVLKQWYEARGIKPPDGRSTRWGKSAR